VKCDDSHVELRGGNGVHVDDDVTAVELEHPGVFFAAAAAATAGRGG
jgi:hypothetical protein